MRKCYCGKKLGYDIKSEYYSTNINIPFSFCNRSCLERFVRDYGEVSMHVDSSIDYYDYKIRENQTGIQVFIHFYDALENHLFSVSNLENYKYFLDFDSEVIDLLREMAYE